MVILSEETKVSSRLTITLPNAIRPKVEARMKEGGFPSLSSYIQYVLRKEIEAGDEKADDDLFRRLSRKLIDQVQNEAD